MNSERNILSRLLEYRVIEISKGDYIYRTADGVCHRRTGDVTRIISYEEYKKLRGDTYQDTDIKHLDIEVQKDITDFRYYYTKILRYSTGPTTMDVVATFDKAIDCMIDSNKTYQDIKNELSKKEINTIRTVISQNSANLMNSI